MLTTDPTEPKLHQQKSNGQNEAYIVLSDEEKAKGFIRPIRDSYIHRGKKNEKGKIEKIIPITDYEFELGRIDTYYNFSTGYSHFAKYSESESPVIGRYIKKDEAEQLIKNKEYIGGCGTLTRMGVSIAETYARDPKFYGSTFCCGCNKHLPVNEFVWDGTNEELGS
jgi:hypothetical protein